MKGHVYRRGKNWSYLFNIDPDPLTGKRRQSNGSGYRTEREAWKACRDAMAEYEKGRAVSSSRARWRRRRKLNPGLEPKTVVNTRRMLHRAWEDFTTWGWAKRNLVSDAQPPRVPRKGRKVCTVAQLQTFLQRAQSDRFFALWVLE